VCENNSLYSSLLGSSLPSLGYYRYQAYSEEGADNVIQSAHPKVQIRSKGFPARF